MGEQENLEQQVLLSENNKKMATLCHL